MKHDRMLYETIYESLSAWNALSLGGNGPQMSARAARIYRWLLARKRMHRLRVEQSEGAA